MPTRQPRHADPRRAGTVAIVVLSITLLAGLVLLSLRLFGPPDVLGVGAPPSSTGVMAVAGSGATVATTVAASGGVGQEGTAPTVEANGAIGPDDCSGEPSVEAETEISGIGDSIMLAATPALEGVFQGGIAVDAAEGRQFAASGPAVERLRERGDLADVVVVHLGTNGPVSSDEFDGLMSILTGVPRVVFVNVSVPRSWEGEVNQVLANGAARWGNAEVADWNGASDGRSEWFQDDGYHLGCQGMLAYAEFIAEVVGEE